MRSGKALLNIISNLLLQIFLVIYGFVVPKIIISSFGSNVNGLVSSITQFLGYIALLQAGFGPVVKSILYKPIAKKDKKEIQNILYSTEKFFRRIAKVFLVYIILLAIIYPNIVSKEFDYFYTFSMIIIISISTFAEYYFGMTYSLYLQAEQKTYVISCIQIITYMLSIILIVILSKLNVSIHIIKLVSGLIFILRPILQNLYVKEKYKINLKEADKNYIIKNKWDGLAQHIASIIHDNTDITLLTIFRNLDEVSVYSIYSLVTRGVRNVVFGIAGGIDSTFGDMIAKNEKENLRKKFGLYETIYDFVITIAYSCTMILIVPFVMVYTKGITDANYIVYSFGILMTLSEYIFAIRMPYSTLTKAAGHFKETRIGAWVECGTNIVISLILVNKFGIVGVAIGTIVAMVIRTVEFVYHTNKYILNRAIWISCKKIILVAIQTLLIVVVSKYLPFDENVSYLNWIINAIMTLFLSIVIATITNLIFYKKEFIQLFKIVKNIFNRKNIKVES